MPTFDHNKKYPGTGTYPVSQTPIFSEGMSVNEILQALDYIEGTFGRTWNVLSDKDKAFIKGQIELLLTRLIDEEVRAKAANLLEKMK